MTRILGHCIALLTLLSAACVALVTLFALTGE